MKKTESKITLTFVIFFVAGFILYGIYNSATLGRKFFSIDVLANAILVSLVYLLFVWLETRKHRQLAALGIVAVCALVVFSTGSNDMAWRWKDTILVIYMVAEYIVALYYARCLIKEDIARKKRFITKVVLKLQEKPKESDIDIDLD